MPRKRWQEQAERVSELTHGVWYRSPLWEKDHLLGRAPEFVEDGSAYCGRALALAMEGWGDNMLEGLWITNRTAAQCSQCDRREKEWKESQPTPANYEPF